MRKVYSVAIDGPAGAGKSTMAKVVAKELGFVYVDTGAIYRTVGYHMDLMGIGPKDIDGITRLIDDINLKLTYDEDGLQHMILNGADVTDEIRTPKMSKIASEVSKHKIVRDFLLDTQRNVAKEHSVIMDGRDIGTVVLPNADVKIFLTASVEVRAQRRYKELIEKGQKVSYADVLRDMEERDYQDTHRAIAPLKCASDAVRLDTGDMDLLQSIEAMKKIIKDRIDKC